VAARQAGRPQLDEGYARLAQDKDGDLALDYLTDILSPDDSGFDLQQFNSVKHRLATGDRDRLFKLVVRWLLTGNHKLCAAVFSPLCVFGVAFLYQHPVVLFRQTFESIHRCAVVEGKAPLTCPVQPFT
jgi:hypothetical protein